MKRSWLCLALTFLITPQVSSKDIVVIKTSNLTSVEEMVSGFTFACLKDIHVDVLDMQGGDRRNDEIINFIDEKKSNDQLGLLYTIGSPATLLARENFLEIPTFYSMVKNYQQKGLRADYRQEVSKESLLTEQVKILKMALPESSKIGVVYDPDNNQAQIPIIEYQTKLIGLDLLSYPVTSSKEVPVSIRKAVHEVDALIILSDPTVVNSQSLKYLVTITLEHQIPTIAYNNVLANAGFLFSLSPDSYIFGQKVANNICKMSEEAQSGESDPPLTFELSINSKTASRLGIVISEELLGKAKYIIR